MTEQKKKELLMKIIKTKEQINKILREVYNSAVIVDYEEYVKQKSKELYGKVKNYYTIQEASQILGLTRQAVYYHIRTGKIATKNGKISFEDLVILTARSLD